MWFWLIIKLVRIWPLGWCELRLAWLRRGNLCSNRVDLPDPWSFWPFLLPLEAGLSGDFDFYHCSYLFHWNWFLIGRVQAQTFNKVLNWIECLEKHSVHQRGINVLVIAYHSFIVQELGRSNNRTSKAHPFDFSTDTVFSKRNATFLRGFFLGPRVRVM